MGKFLNAIIPRIGYIDKLIVGSNAPWLVKLADIGAKRAPTREHGAIGIERDDAVIAGIGDKQSAVWRNRHITWSSQAALTNDALGLQRQVT